MEFLQLWLLFRHIIRNKQESFFLDTSGQEILSMLDKVKFWDSLWASLLQSFKMFLFSLFNMGELQLPRSGRFLCELV